MFGLEKEETVVVQPVLEAAVGCGFVFVLGVFVNVGVVFEPGVQPMHDVVESVAEEEVGS